MLFGAWRSQVDALSVCVEIMTRSVAVWPQCTIVTDGQTDGQTTAVRQCRLIGFGAMSRQKCWWWWLAQFQIYATCRHDRITSHLYVASCWHCMSCRFRFSQRSSKLQTCHRLKNFTSRGGVHHARQVAPLPWYATDITEYWIVIYTTQLIIIAVHMMKSRPQRLDLDNRIWRMVSTYRRSHLGLVSDVDALGLVSGRF